LLPSTAHDAVTNINWYIKYDFFESVPNVALSALSIVFTGWDGFIHTFA